MNPKKVYAIDPALSNRIGFNIRTIEIWEWLLSE